MLHASHVCVVLLCCAVQVAQEEFVPQHMPVYCICELPYNPDKFMVQCSACLNCESLGLSARGARRWGPSSVAVSWKLGAGAGVHWHKMACCCRSWLDASLFLVAVIAFVVADLRHVQS